MRLDDRNVTEVAAVLLDLRRIVGAIHEIVEAGHPRCRHGRQRNSRLAVVQAGRGQDGADRKVAIGHVQASPSSTS